jgi:DNA-binding NarL/FixJ family response regulator
MFKVLLVEDNADFRHSLNKSLMLSFPAMVIAESADGKDAMVKIDYFKPDLVFMDIKLPDENGLNLTKNIKAKHSDITVIIMTANDAPEYCLAAFQAGATYFIDKGSVPTERIPSIIEALLGPKVSH